MKKRINPEADKFRRVFPVTVQLNELEMEALNKYCKKYKVKNRSKFIREALVTAILKKFDEDYPSLFEEESNNKKATLSFDF